MHQRKIPSSGEMLPVIGCGTWRTFDVGGKPEDRAPLAEVLKVLFDSGGSAIDTSPMYGAAGPSSPPKSGPRGATTASPR